jgi:hypothetical protein
MRNEIYHQYAHSPKLVGLINGLAEGLSPQNSLKAFYDNVFNINSASGGGLDVWGDIFNIKRSLTLTLPNKSNYVTEIPQDIKLELNNGTLTLKAGSKVYVPNGVGVFDTVTIASDINLIYDYAPSSDSSVMLFINQSGTSFVYARLESACYSGTTQPSGNYRNWYNTDENKMYSIGNGVIDGSGFSFPIAKITQGSDGVTKSIDQVFNGFGYIGNTVFALPGVKGLIPDGRNADGSFKNIEFTVSGVLTRDIGNVVVTDRDLLLNATYIGFVECTYNIADNLLYNPDEEVVRAIEAGKITTDGSKITSLTPKLTSPTIDVEQQYTMTDDKYRLILKLAASKNISDATCENIYTVLNTVFSEMGNIYVSDLGEMHLRYSFEFLLSDTMYAILRQTKVVPRPAGVGIEIYEIPSRKIIGFNGQELETLNNGTFFQGVRNE